jgi:hypothetical protein
MFASLILAAVLSPLPAATEADPLQPLRFLVGHCWSGEFANGGGSDTHCFEPMYGNRFVRDRHVVRGKGADYLGESVYGFDAKRKRVVYWYWSNAGVMDNGDVEAVADGLNFPEHHLTQPKDLIMRTRWKRLGDDRYEALNEHKAEDGAWQTDWKALYVRDDAAKADAAH